MTLIQTNFSLVTWALFIFCAPKIVGQKTDQKLILKSDNDLYTSFYYDRYYTNGLFISYSKAQKKDDSKRIHQFLFGHRMYTPQNAHVNTRAAIDRPYAGHVFLNYQLHYYSTKNFALYPSVQIGMIGEVAQAEVIQNLIHQIYGFKKGDGWGQQIKNTFEFNIGLQLIKPLEKKFKKHFDFTSVTNFHIGTALTEVNTSILARINLRKGFLNKYDNTTLFNSNLNSDKKQVDHELFLFFKPQLGLLFHDATIQGSLFTYNSPVTTGIAPFVYEIETGFEWVVNKFSIGYSFTHYSKRSSSMITSTNNYGTIQLAFIY